MDLREDYSQYVTVAMNMIVAMEEHGYLADIDLVQGPDPTTYDLLCVTKRIYGDFENIEPAGEEVLQNCFKEVMKPESEVYNALVQVFG